MYEILIIFIWFSAKRLIIWIFILHFSNSFMKNQPQFSYSQVCMRRHNWNKNKKSRNGSFHHISWYNLDTHTLRMEE